LDSASRRGGSLDRRVILRAAPSRLVRCCGGGSVRRGGLLLPLRLCFIWRLLGCLGVGRCYSVRDGVDRATNGRWIGVPRRSGLGWRRERRDRMGVWVRLKIR